MAKRRVRGTRVEALDLDEEQLYRLANIAPRWCDSCEITCGERKKGKPCAVLSRWAQKRRRELSDIVPDDLQPLADSLVWLESLSLSQRASGDIEGAKKTINLIGSTLRCLCLGGRERSLEIKAKEEEFDLFGRD